jgi:hypothetical protein
MLPAGLTDGVATQEGDRDTEVLWRGRTRPGAQRGLTYDREETQSPCPGFLLTKGRGLSYR